MFLRFMNTKAALTLFLVANSVFGSSFSNVTTSASMTAANPVPATITADTTLYGNQIATSTVEIAEGATLKLLDGNSYEFSSGLIVRGSLEIGNDTSNVEDLYVTVSGSTLDVSGTIDIKNTNEDSPSTVEFKANNFVNTGSISLNFPHESLGRATFGPFTNRGTFNISGTNLYSNNTQKLTRRANTGSQLDGDIYLWGNSVYHIADNFSGSGTIHGRSYSILVLNEAESFEGPKISLEGGALQIRYAEGAGSGEPIKLEGYTGANHLTIANDAPRLHYDQSTGILTCSLNGAETRFVIGTQFDPAGFYVASGYIISYNYFDDANFIDYRTPVSHSTSTLRSVISSSTLTSSSVSSTPSSGTTSRSYSIDIGSDVSSSSLASSTSNQITSNSFISFSGSQYITSTAGSNISLTTNIVTGSSTSIISNIPSRSTSIISNIPSSSTSKIDLSISSTISSAALRTSKPFYNTSNLVDKASHSSHSSEISQSEIQRATILTLNSTDATATSCVPGFNCVTIKSNTVSASYSQFNVSTVDATKPSGKLSSTTSFKESLSSFTETKPSSASVGGITSCDNNGCYVLSIVSPITTTATFCEEKTCHTTIATYAPSTVTSTVTLCDESGCHPVTTVITVTTESETSTSIVTSKSNIVTSAPTTVSDDATITIKPRTSEATTCANGACREPDRSMISSYSSSQSPMIQSEAGAALVECMKWRAIFGFMGIIWLN